MQIYKGTVVQFHYKIEELDGNVLESNFGEEAVAYLHGYNNMMPGIEKSLESMSKGDEVEVELEAAETYGEIQPDSEQRVAVKYLLSRDKKPKWKPGMVAAINTEHGQREVTLVKVGKFMATIDTNHPLAGKTLKFNLKVEGVRAATDEEIEHGHAHGVGGHHH
ncbi:FKBP-type peptidyl-prolyl cis-trans isomerase [Paraglaciecola aquimarina]|uniref:Peptidyl-prolyl cis-trans isomerase n=1 Tax=Paraglaciecola aquimarina TaxID=1235557 RepID=A0ABU3SZM6_9ALTE|nr:FKBP-type peptidyl-prolyl cis-trans isomerase [Paraglaciecola aquimarina]MDU0355458.1 FKBP-type peptidyl-prolyl cis-trans isomerase [Paraglaciecola aquimarina]